MVRAKKKKKTQLERERERERERDLRKLKSERGNMLDALEW